MLVLSRKAGQTVHIEIEPGREITVLVVAIRPGSVRLGFKADENTVITRSEILDRQRHQQGPEDEGEAEQPS